MGLNAITFRLNRSGLLVGMIQPVRRRSRLRLSGDAAGKAGTDAGEDGLDEDAPIDAPSGRRQTSGAHLSSPLAFNSRKIASSFSARSRRPMR